MKPTSYIFCALAVILIITGIITCAVAGSIANSDGIELFEGDVDENGNKVFRIDLSGRTISRYELTIDDANVNIYGGAEKSRIELVNINPNSYSYSINNRTITLSDSLSILSFFSFGGDGPGFKGLRYYFASNDYSDAEKSVNIYIADSSAINIIDLTVENGNVAVNDLNESISYKINVGNGDIEVKSVISNMDGQIDCTNGKVSLHDTYIKKLNVDIIKGEFEEILLSAGRNSYDLTAKSGTIYVGGADKGGEYDAVSTIEAAKVTVTVNKGDIIIDTR